MFPAKILLATDGSEVAVRAAVELANKTGSELDPALAEEEARKVLDDEVRRIEGEGGTVAESHLRLGPAEENIVNLGERLGVGLIAIGSRGLGTLRRAVMGSVSESVVRHAHCPVMVVRPEH